VRTRRDVAPHLRVTREPQRGRYDRATIDAILDEALVSHLGFVDDDRPFVIPTLHARVADVVYVHGSAASRMLRGLAGGAPVCLTATIFDGLVLAKSVFNHSVDYRSVVVVGTATLVGDAEKRDALRALTEQLAPGRWDEARQPTAQELKATWILSLPLDDASAKVRSGPPEDEPEDESLPVWSGVVPVHLAAEPSEYDWRRVRDGRVGPPRTRDV
jgi:nitroimidazol reductase NimA-like FMN-containing flavoprotein (pyridoxamine 5'-phosphate oxidase superfamily)